MNRTFTLIFSFFALVCGDLWAQQYSHARIYATPNALGKLGIAVDHVLTDGRTVTGDFSRYEVALARKFGYEVLIIHDDAEEAYTIDHHSKYMTKRSQMECVEDLQSFEHDTPTHFKLGSMKGHYTYEEMHEELDLMASLYPEIITVRKNVGDFYTAEERPIEWVRISDNPELEEDGEPQMLYTALHHAREPIGLTQLIYYMWYLLENYSVDEEIRYLIDHTELYFLPCVNPDGYVYNQTQKPQGGGLWRKNRKVNEDGTIGVDINRNYGFHWGFDNVGSSNKPESETYRGPSPFSEVETQAVRHFVKSHDFKLALNYHSWGDFLIYPFGYTENPTEDVAVFRELAQILTRENRYVYGTGMETVAYPTNGDADDWMYGSEEIKKIFAMTPEMGDETHGFWPAEEEVEYLCKTALSQNVEVAKFLLNTGIFIDNSESFITSKQGLLPYRITKLGFDEIALNLSFSPVTDNISFMSSSKLYFLDIFGAQQDKVEFKLAPGIQDGERIKFSYTFDNGVFIRTDTIVKYYREPRFVLENAGDYSDWISPQLNEEWALSERYFVSPPTSLTDSPNGNTIPYTTNYLASKERLLLQGGDSTVLTFKALWDIQNQFDYMLVELSTDDENFVPLCGKYSVGGRLNINKDLPIYTGRQLDWIIESIDLTEFMEEEISIRFAMVSTNSGTKDGIYLDDIKVLIYDQGSLTSANNLEDLNFEQIVFPNPSAENIYLSHEFVSSEYTQVDIFNSLGMRVKNKIIHPDFKLDVSDWTPGVYYCQFIRKNGVRTKGYKLIVQ